MIASDKIASARADNSFVGSVSGPLNQRGRLSAGEVSYHVRKSARPAYNAGMGLKDIDMDAALRRLADRRIEEAMREGKFSNLPGSGKPLDLEPMPAEEGARLRWWALRILKQNDVIPDEVAWRKRIDKLKDELGQATSAARVTALVTAINGIVRQLNTLGTNALSAPVAAVSLEGELRRLRERGAVPVLPIHPPPPPAVRPAPAARIRTCVVPACGMRNPLSARFCRRCGALLGS